MAQEAAAAVSRSMKNIELWAAGRRPAPFTLSGKSYLHHHHHAQHEIRSQLIMARWGEKMLLSEFVWLRCVTDTAVSPFCFIPDCMRCYHSNNRCCPNRPGLKFQSICDGDYSQMNSVEKEKSNLPPVGHSVGNRCDDTCDASAAVLCPAPGSHRRIFSCLCNDRVRGLILARPSRPPRRRICAFLRKLICRQLYGQATTHTQARCAL